MSWGFRYSVGAPAGGQVAPGGFLSYHCSSPQAPSDTKAVPRALPPCLRHLSPMLKAWEINRPPPH